MHSKQHNYWIYGKHTVMGAIKNSKRKVYKLLATEETYAYLCERLPASLLKDCKVTSRAEIESILKQKCNHQGVAASVSEPQAIGIREWLDSRKSESSDLVLMLDQVTDPQNLGAIMRSAAAFGASAIIVPKASSVGITPTVARISCGTCELVPLVVVPNLVQAIDLLKDNNYWTIALSHKTDKLLAEAKGMNKTCLVLGAEGKGIRKLVLKNSDLVVKIPISDKVESLNVATTSAIALYELAASSP